jgi:excinuclease UvrABC nuclease subunit
MCNKSTLLKRYIEKHPQINWEVSHHFLDLHHLDRGVYQFQHIPTQMIYVGSSFTLLTRIKYHFQAGTRGEHFNEKFQELWNASGDNDFVIDFMPLAGSILEAEQMAIDAVLPEFRINKKDRVYFPRYFVNMTAYIQKIKNQK